MVRKLRERVRAAELEVAVCRAVHVHGGDHGRAEPTTLLSSSLHDAADREQRLQRQLHESAAVVQHLRGRLQGTDAAPAPHDSLDTVEGVVARDAAPHQPQSSALLNALRDQLAATAAQAEVWVVCVVRVSQLRLQVGDGTLCRVQFYRCSYRIACIPAGGVVLACIVILARASASSKAGSAIAPRPRRKERHRLRCVRIWTGQLCVAVGAVPAFSA